MNLSDIFKRPRTRLFWVAVPLAILLFWGIMMLWLNHEPDLFDPAERSTIHAREPGHSVVTGYTTTATLIEAANVLLDKRGGY